MPARTGRPAMGTNLWGEAMMRRRLGVALIGGACLLLAAPARSQVVPTAGPIYSAPGNFGMAWGFPSYGLARTYSNFSSPFGGVAYGYGLNPYGLVPGPYGATLWRPGFSVPGYSYGTGYYGYRTYPIAVGPTSPIPGPPVGYYAPYFGPPGVFPH